ncbi:hypothetical protein CALVIDRAFT_543363 [Calocera viscosa TUFC12733]|uniref:CMP/dCMP-type deaminase domain-containing protein n=1 Tax=Calocera viscosa (strain TUFC12733) TaxID=1330018 RepID=A0A167FNI8_CALVF|nr:hypothetical protein CALVIDRAFT_543363 [Calocera viscosa TUFC12733]
MNKSQIYLSECLDTAQKSSMAYMLGAIIVKGGKVLSHGHNHRRTHYDGSPGNETHQTAMSMHAEMHAIYSATGFSPAFKTQRTALVAANESRFELGALSASAADGGQGEHEYAAWDEEPLQGAQRLQRQTSAVLLSSRPLSPSSRVRRVSVPTPPRTSHTTRAATTRSPAAAAAAAAARAGDIRRSAFDDRAEQGLKGAKDNGKPVKRAA